MSAQEHSGQQAAVVLGTALADQPRLQVSACQMLAGSAATPSNKDLWSTCLLPAPVFDQALVSKTDRLCHGHAQKTPGQTGQEGGWSESMEETVEGQRRPGAGGKEECWVIRAEGT